MRLHLQPFLAPSGGQHEGAEGLDDGGAVGWRCSAELSAQPRRHGHQPVRVCALGGLEYLTAEFGLHSQRIDEKRSANKRGPQGNR